MQQQMLLARKRRCREREEAMASRAAQDMAARRQQHKDLPHEDEAEAGSDEDDDDDDEDYRDGSIAAVPPSLSPLSGGARMPHPRAHRSSVIQRRSAVLRRTPPLSPAALYTPAHSPAATPGLDFTASPSPGSGKEGAGKQLLLWSPAAPNQPSDPGDEHQAGSSDDAGLCWLCTFSTHPLARQIETFINSTISAMDVSHVAVQSRHEILTAFPRARGVELQDVRKHISDHMLSPQVLLPVCWSFSPAPVLTPSD